MNQSRSCVFRLPVLLLMFSSFFWAPVNAQQFQTTINGWNAYVHLPDDYNTTTRLYPAIVFLPGLGEVGSNITDLLAYGPSRFVAQGHNMQFMVNNVLEKPIVISMQPPAAWPNPVSLERQIDSIFRRWRVDVNRLSITGLSMGGSVWENYIATRTEYALRPASIVAMSAPTPSVLNNFTFYAQNGGKWWGFEGTADARQMNLIRDVMNLAVPGSARYTTYIGGHCCWNTWYDPNWTENGENIYVWMLKQVRNNSVIPNNPPIANAGNDQVITLPVNSVTLAGTGTDADGSISGYSWTKIAGPVQYSITNNSLAQTTVTGLAAGIYQFRLQVQDNAGAQDADTVTVTVNAAVVPPPVNVPPVANAGNDQVITLPVNSITLAGTGTDADGSISGYSWTKIAGPVQYSITNNLLAQTTVTGLAAGIYQFRLQVQDNAGTQDADTVTVTVNAAVVPPPVPPANLPPVANAGNDSEITIPEDAVSLQGSGFDPDGILIAHQWRQVKGPIQYTFANEQLALTRVTNLQQGVYDFEYEVTDNNGAKARDTVRVTVHPVAVSSVTVFPNPVLSTGLINIRVMANTKTDLSPLKIYDMTNRIVYQEMFIRTQGSMMKQVDVSSLGAGTYIIEIGLNINKRISCKLVKR